ncbi:MAG: hypothetical protein HY909_23825 [Deltaproteobacteria bacterium]|nr:hypothetical protein [Deltaproteobacteria bacterium]
MEGSRQGARGAWVGLAMLLWGSGASAQPWVREGLYYRNTTLARLNPLGLFNELRVGYRHRLSHRAAPIFQNTFVGLSANLAASPAFLRPGVVLDFNPLAVLQLFAMYEFTQYFGTFQFLQSFPSASAAHADSLLRSNAANGLNQATTEHRVTFGATLQARVDALAIRTASRLTWISADVRAGDRALYDIWYDAMAQNGGWVYANDTDLLISFPELGFAGGLRYSLVHALYGPGAYGPGEAQDNPNTPTQRLGPFVALTFRERRRGWFNAPTVFALVNWWISHRYRTGEDSHPALPYVVLGLQFRGD